MDDSISLSFLLQDIVHPLKEKYAIYKPAEGKKKTLNTLGTFSPCSWISAYPLQAEYKTKKPQQLYFKMTK